MLGGACTVYAPQQLLCERLPASPARKTIRGTIEGLSMCKRVQVWWYGKLAVEDNPLVTFIGIERHRSARAARGVVAFLATEWKWTSGFVVAPAGLVLAYLRSRAPRQRSLVRRSAVLCSWSAATSSEARSANAWSFIPA
jgi:hypothetical protein